MRVDRTKPELTVIETPQIKIIPAIERLEELQVDMVKLVSNGIGLSELKSLHEFKKELQSEALKDFKHKWGLTM